MAPPAFGCVRTEIRTADPGVAVGRARQYRTVSRHPYPFVGVFAAAVATGVLAAALAPDRAPAIALYWNPIYRAEAGAAAAVVLYLLGVAGWMVWHGRALRRIAIPVGAVERDAEALDAACRRAGRGTAAL